MHLKYEVMWQAQWNRVDVSHAHGCDFMTVLHFLLRMLSFRAHFSRGGRGVNWSHRVSFMSGFGAHFETGECCVKFFASKNGTKFYNENQFFRLVNEFVILSLTLPLQLYSCNLVWECGSTVKYSTFLPFFLFFQLCKLIEWKRLKSSVCM